jgi:hypothetical protein
MTSWAMRAPRSSRTCSAAGCRGGRGSRLHHAPEIEYLGQRLRSVLDELAAEFAERDQPRQIGPRRAEGRPPVRQIERA